MSSTNLRRKEVSPIRDAITELLGKNVSIDHSHRKGVDERVMDYTGGDIETRLVDPGCPIHTLIPRTGAP